MGKTGKRLSSNKASGGQGAEAEEDIPGDRSLWPGVPGVGGGGWGWRVLNWGMEGRTLYTYEKAEQP